jgi:hypothetical protein
MLMPQADYNNVYIIAYAVVKLLAVDEVVVLYNMHMK